LLETSNGLEERAPMKGMAKIADRLHPPAINSI